MELIIELNYFFPVRLIHKLTYQPIDHFGHDVPGELLPGKEQGDKIYQKRDHIIVIHLNFCYDFLAHQVAYFLLLQWNHLADDLNGSLLYIL